MKLATALLCLSATVALAQQKPFDQPFEPTVNRDTPTVVTQFDKTTGEVAGTTTIVDGEAYLRDKNGAHYATLTINQDGSRSMTDPQGRPITPADIKQILKSVK